MKKPSDFNKEWDEKRSKIMGFGERSSRKSYYPELQNKLAEFERFRALLDKIHDAIFVFEFSSKKIKEINHSAEIILKTNSKEIINSSFLKYFSNADKRKIKAWFDKKEKSPDTFSLITTLVSKNKSETKVEINIDLRAFSGKVFGIAVVRDITERIKINNELIKAKEAAESANKLKSEFLAQMSHEIRTPVNSLLSFSSLLQYEMKDLIQDEISTYFEIISSAGNRLIRTIDSILNMAQLQTGSIDINPESFNIIKDVLEKLVLEYQPMAKNKNLELSIVIQTTKTLAYGDKYSIAQIFDNLLNNAIKYTNKGSVSVIVSRNRSNGLVIEIKDTGIGISKKYIPELFQPFSQEEQGYTRKFEGNGLGLSLVKEYCTLNNAQINVKSRKGTGSSFIVTFPNITPVKK